MTNNNPSKTKAWIRYRALQRSRKTGMTIEEATNEIIKEENSLTTKKPRRIKACNKADKNRKKQSKKKIDRKLAETYAKKEKISVNYAYLVLRGQWTLKKAKKTRTKCKCWGCSRGKKCTVRGWIRFVSGGAPGLKK